MQCIDLPALQNEPGVAAGLGFVRFISINTVLLCVFSLL